MSIIKVTNAPILQITVGNFPNHFIDHIIIVISSIRDVICACLNRINMILVVMVVKATDEDHMRMTARCDQVIG